MKKIIFTILAMLVLSPTSSKAEKMDCTQFEKVSAKYLECSAKNLKGKSVVLKLKATVGVEELKEKITKNAAESKRKFNTSNLKEKLIKFKKSKTLTQFMEE